MLMGKGDSKVGVSADSTIIKQRRAEEKERCPRVTATFFGVPQAVVSCVPSSSLLYSHMYNRIPKPLFLVVHLNLCYKRIFMW